MKEIWPQLRERWKGALKRYQYVLLVMAAGVLLMMLPMGPSGGSEEAQGPPEGEGQFDLELFEEKLSQVLSDIQGAGKTRVVLTLKSGSRQILAQNVDRDGERSSASAVAVGQGAGTEGVVPLYTLTPQFQGALVVCPGGGDPAVQLRLLEAVSALTGLGSDRISICEGN